MKLSQNKQILLVVVVFGLFAGGIIYDEFYRKKKKPTVTIQPMITPPPITFHLVDSYYFGQDCSSSGCGTTIKHFTPTGQKDFYGMFHTTTSLSNSLESVWCEFGHPEGLGFTNEDVSSDVILDLIKLKYREAPLGEDCLNLYNKIIDYRKLIIKFKRKNVPSYIGSSDEDTDIIYLKTDENKRLFLSPDRKVLVEVYFNEQGNKCSTVRYNSYLVWSNQEDGTLRYLNSILKKLTDELGL
jgi:hypothetical protein